MSMTFKKFADGELTVELSGAGAPDLNELMQAADAEATATSPQSAPPIPGGPS